MDKEAQPWLEIVMANGIRLEDGQIGRLCQYHGLLLDWNTRVNLVSRKDVANIWPNHILHSISLLFLVKIGNGVSVGDIGSGGGLPGIPLAILLPGVEFVLIESVRKKCIAMTDMITKLKIPNARVINGRAEEVGRSSLARNRFDIIVARAVAPLTDLVKWSVQMARRSTAGALFTDPEGEKIMLPALVSFKGGDVTREITDVQESDMRRRIQSHEVRFKGVETTGFVDKKVIIVSL